MYQILVAGPTENSSRSNLAAVAKTAAFFTSDCAECHGSLDVNDVDLCDALVVPGGIADVDPAFYGEENVACGEIDKALDEQQLKMIARAVEQKKPVFGICRGLQLICGHFGAALVQDIVCSAEHKPAAKGKGASTKYIRYPEVPWKRFTAKRRRPIVFTIRLSANYRRVLR